MQTVLTGEHEARRAFERDGFCHVRAVFTEAEVEQMRSRALALLLEVEAGRELPRVAHFGHDSRQVRDILGVHELDRSFKLVMMDQRLLALAQVLLGSATVNPLWLHLRNSVPGFGGVSAHRDSLGCTQDPRICLSTWIALGRYAIEDGCLFYVAGSHLEPPTGDAPRSAIPEKRIPMAVGPGDVLCHGWQTLHGSLPNRSCRRRLALMACYQSRHDG